MLTIIKGVAKVRTLLGALSIRSRDDAIAWLHFRSIVNSKDIGERLTAEATNHLEEKCDTCDVHESSDGMQVRRIVKEIKVYNETPAVVKATEAVRKAKETLEAKELILEAAKEKAGFTTKEGKPYYQAVK